MGSNAESFLGSGMAYPFKLVNGAALIVSGRELVAQDLFNLLSTDKGENFFLPERGSRLSELMFEPNDDVLATLARQFIFEAIEDWETRVKFTNATFDFFDLKQDSDLVNEESRSRVDITISFKILASNEVDSFIFPFYREIKF